MAAKSGLQKAIYTRENLPPLSIFPDGSIGHYARYRIISEDRNRQSHWSPVYAVTVPDFEYLGTVDIDYTATTITAIWGDEYNRPRYDVYVRWGNGLKDIKIVSGITTIKTDVAHGFSSGDTVQIVGTGLSYLDGNSFIITEVGGHPDEFTIPLVGVADGNHVLPSGSEAKLSYFYHGTSPTHTYSFLRLSNFDYIHVDIQVESIEKVYSQSLLIYDSPAKHLT